MACLPRKATRRKLVGEEMRRKKEAGDNFISMAFLSTEKWHEERASK